jgi:tetratricopeptide (TPR) repeat protein
VGGRREDQPDGRRGPRSGGQARPGREGAWDKAGGQRPGSQRPGSQQRGESSHRGSAAPRLDIPESITADQLDPEARAELRTLPGDLADAVARRLVAASQAEDPQQAYEYAQAARQLATRVGIVRETCGIAAYQAGEWADALAELRTARRLTGRAGYLPLMADCERALGRPDRALAIIKDPAAGDVDRATQIELRIVESGVRRDQGRPDAAVVALQLPELTDGRLRPWSAGLFYAYADALLDAGRDGEAREWFGRAAAADTDQETDAIERLEELDPVTIEDLADAEEAGAEEAAAGEADRAQAEYGDGPEGAEPEDLAAPGETGPDETGPDETGPDETGPDGAGPEGTEPGNAGPGAEG